MSTRESASVYRDVLVELTPQPQKIGGGRNMIAVVGIDHYRSWPRLENAVNDAKGVLELFTGLGFEAVVPPLLQEKATADAMRRLVADDLAALSQDDNLVLFYAGHGHTVVHEFDDGTSVKSGHIIPADADEPGGSTAAWVRVDAWLNDVAHLRARHILVILDACHSGIALGSLVRWRDLAAAPTSSFAELRLRRSRRVITSALDDQRAMDSGPIAGHSLFTGCLIEGLTAGLASEGRELTTGTEIGLYVQRRVMTYPGSEQTPDFGAFELDDRGELVMTLRKGTPLGDTAPRPRPVLPFRPRAVLGAGGALIAICTLGFAVFALFLSLRPPTATDARPVGSGSAPPRRRAEATPVPPDAGGAGPPDAEPPVVLSYDPRRFDGLAMLPEAIRLANAAGQVDDFEVVYLSTPNVRPDGTADLTLGESSVHSVTLVSETLMRWPADVPRGANVELKEEVRVYFRADRRPDVRGPLNTAYHGTLRPLPPPRCTYAQIWARAIQKGADPNAVAYIRYDWSGFESDRHRQPEWSFRIGKDFDLRFPNDCNGPPAENDSG